jgi:hypothetical protein
VTPRTPTRIATLFSLNEVRSDRFHARTRRRKEIASCISPFASLRDITTVLTKLDSTTSPKTDVSRERNALVSQKGEPLIDALTCANRRSHPFVVFSANDPLSPRLSNAPCFAQSRLHAPILRISVWIECLSKHRRNAIPPRGEKSWSLVSRSLEIRITHWSSARCGA